MARVKGAMMTRKRRNKTLKLAKGYWGNKSRHFKMANQAVMKSLTYAYTGRKLKKRDFRSLWITRISAACKMNGMNYSTFMHGLKVKRHRDQPQDAQRDGDQRRRRVHRSLRPREERVKSANEKRRCKASLFYNKGVILYGGEYPRFSR